MADPIWCLDFWFLRGNGVKLQSWTKLVEANVKSSCKFKKWLTFFKKNYPPYPLISMLNLAMFCCHQPKTLQATFYWGRGFSQKFFFVEFVATVLSGIVGNYNFWKYPTKLLKRITITMHSNMLYALN